MSKSSRAARLTRIPHAWISRLRSCGNRCLVGVTWLLLGLGGGPVTAADFYWDTDASNSGNDVDGTNLGGTSTWDLLTSNWWPVPSGALTTWGNTTADRAIFTYEFPSTPYAIPTPFTVTLGSGITANQLLFERSGYTLTGGDLTLAGTTPGLHAKLGESATIASQILGTDGLTKTGGGSIRLTNATNSYTGTTSINNGTLIINSAAALGGTGTVSIITNNNTPLNTGMIGFTGGSLVLDGTSAGFTFSRDVDFEGRGPIGDRGSAILSLGNNTLSGILRSAISPLPLSPTASIRNSRINSINGTLTLSGTLNVGGTAGTTITNLGGVNSAGVGDYSLTGVLTGTGTLEKSGAGTLFLNASDTSGFSGRLRVSGSATTGHQSSVRISSLNDVANTTSIFGTANGTTTSAPIDVNGGVLEIRSDSSLNFGKNVYQRASSTIFVGPAVGGAGVNGTVTFGSISYEDNTTLTFNSRNGYGVSFTTAPVTGSTAGDNNSTITNNMGGTLSFTGNFWSNANNTGNRTMSIGGNGNTIINGNVVASAAAFNHNLTKTGSGALTITGTGSTLDGDVSVQGSLIITDFRSITNNAANITLGNATTTAGNLIIGTSTAATAGGLTTSKAIILNGTTAGNSIYANQTGANPVILNGTITKPVSGNATLNLGGSNTADNIINSAIPSLGTGGILKVGAGTWVLAGVNSYTGATNITNGTLKLKANAATSTILPSTNAVTFGASNGFAGGTLEFVGQDGVNNVQNLGTLSYASNGANTLKVSPGAGGTASLTFANIGTGGAGTLNIVGADFTDNKVTFTQVNAAAGSNGILTRSVYWEGADFAYREGGVLRAPNYGIDGGTATTASGPLTASSNNQITGSFSTGAVSVSTLKINGSHTLTVSSGDLTLSGGGLLVTGGDAEITGAGTLALGSQALVVRVNEVSDDLLLSTTGFTGTGGLTKSGAGTLTIATTNSRTGTTEIAEGTVRLSGSGTLSGANVTTNIRQAGTLDLNGVSTGTSIGQFNNSGLVTNNSNTDATLTIGNTITTNGTAGTSFGIISDGTGSGKTHLTISTANNNAAQTTTFVLNGLSTYTGATTITKATNGNLLVSVNTLADIGEDSSIGRGDDTSDATNAASLVFSGLGGELRYIGNILDGNLTLGSTSASTDRLFTISGSGATLSSTVSNNNAIVWSNTGAIVHGTNANRTLTLTGTSQGDNTLNPQITDSTGFVTSVTKTGTGMWRLGNSNNTYTGATTITQGILMATDGDGLSSGSNLVFDGGTLYSQGTLSRDIGTGAGQMQFAAPANANEAEFIGGFLGGDSKLTVSWTGTPVWGSTAGFISTRDGLMLNGSQARGQGATGSNALSEVEITGNFSLGTASATGKTIAVTTANNSATGTVTTGDTSGLVVGQSITGPNIASGAYIVSINSATQFTMSANASTATATNRDLIANNLRTIRVDDNTQTGADFATISGVISAGDSATGLRKVGNGILRLSGANTYQGETSVYQGTLVVSSLGSSTGGATSSVGASGVAMGNSNAVTLGNGGTGGAILQYVGAGETSDRKIRLWGTTAANQIHADGSGALILTNVAHDTTETGNKTLSLRGSSAAGNMITSQLSNNGAGVLTLTVDGGATWILTNSANNYSGNTNANAGALGIGHDTALGSGTLVFNNGNVFAYGADRTVGNAITHNNNTTAGFIGDHNLTFSTALNLAASANNVTTTNSIAPGKALTFAGGVTANSLTALRAWGLDGPGETVINGNFTSSTAFGVRLDVNGGGTLTLGTNGATSDWNKTSTAVDVDRGTLKFTANNAIPTTFGAVATTTTATVPISTTTFTVASTTGLVVGQTFTGTNVPAGSRILSIDSPTTFTTTIAPTALVASGAALTFVASGGIIISPELATGDTATVDFNGTTQTVNSVTATSNGTVVLDNTSGTDATFRFGENNSAVDFGSGVGSYTITDSGAGALSIVKLGNTSTTFSAGLTLTYQGATRVEGGSLTIASPVDGTTSLEVVNNGSSLALTGGVTTPSAITSVVVEDGGILSLLDGVGNKLTSLTNLQLGSTGGSMTTLNLNVGDSLVSGDELNTDTLTVLTGGTLTLAAGNQITFNLTDAGLNASQTYELLNFVDGGFTGGPLANTDYLLGATPGGFTSISLTANNNSVFITTGTLITGDLFWRGLAGGGTDNTWNAGIANWSLDKANTTPATTIPGQGTDVIFAIDSASGAVSTTLEQNFKINSLTFEAGTTTPTSVTIAPGAVATNRLEIAPQVDTDGIAITTGGPSIVNISAPLKIGANQTWTMADAVDLTGATFTTASTSIDVASTTGLQVGMLVIGAGIPAGATVASITDADTFVLSATPASNQTSIGLAASSTLTLSGGLQGEANVTKAGAGKVILTAAADPTFNTGQTTTFTVTEGNLEFTNSAAFGTTANNNVADIVVNGGGFYYNNGTAGTALTLPHNITLSGGALSGGGANHVYGGTINVSSASTINLADSNGPVTNTARNITLSGILSGSGSLTIDGNNTLAAGTQINGTLTINNAASSWNGDLLFNRGTVTIAATASATVLPDLVNFNSFGRLILQGVDGQVINRAGSLAYAAGTVGEFQVDNTSATQTTGFTVNQNGAVTLGSGGSGATMRVSLIDTQAFLDIKGPITLGGNSSISVSNNANRILKISGVIGDDGNAYGLAVNDDAGGWAQTNGIVRFTGLNTYTGNVSLGGGILEFDTVTNASGGASSLGNGTSITSTANGVLRFIGTTAQSTDRIINASAGVLTLSANGDEAVDTITYNGAITTGGNSITLSGAAGREGIITAGITQTGDAADATVNGGTWTHQTGTTRIGDDMTITGTGTILNLDSGLWQVRDDLTVTANAVLNLNATGVLSFSTATLSGDASLRATAGGVINLGANNAVVVTDFDGLRIGTDAAGIGTLNMGTFNQSVTDFILGNRNLDRSGLVDGTGTLTTTGNIDLYGGTVNANLGSTGAVTLDKISLNTVTLAGDNSALAGTGATVITEGTLILDYSSNTGTKVRAASALDMRGSSLTLNGNASSAVAQSVASFTLGSGGNSIITLNTAGGQDLVLNLNAITRAVNAQDGTIRFNLPSGTQSATNGITTDNLNTLGTGTNAILGGWATVNDGTGTFFARNVPNTTDGNIGVAVTTSTDAVASWLTGENITDSTGFTGTRQPINITSLRFNAAAGSDLTLAPAGVLGITSGGVLVTSNVGGTPSLLNGTVFSGAQASNVPELIVTQDSAATFELGADLRTNSAFTKSGSGTVLLSGNNVYTGTTEIQNGTLQLGGGNAIGNTSLVTLSATRNSTLELLADETIGRLQGGVRQTDQDLGIVNVGNHTLTINQSANTTYSGRFNGSGVIVLNAGSTGNLNYNGQTTTGLFTGSVIVNGGLFQLSGDTARLGSATAFTINGSGNFLLDNDATANVTDRISDTATFTLNSVAGPFSGQTIVRGLAMRNNDNDDAAETIGSTTFNSGTNYLSLEASGGTSAQSRIISTGWTRNNTATVNVRGRNLGATADATGRTQFKVQDANDAAMLAANVGGGGTIGGTAKNVSIIPWAIGESLTAALADGNMGNTFLSYVDNRGFVPLHLTNEFTDFAGVVTPQDNVRESLGADLTGIAGTTVNSLILNNTAVSGLDVSGSGVSQTLTVTSGALMFTVTGGAASTAYDTTLGGFDDGITVGGTNEYVIHVVNPSSAATTSTLTATIASQLTSSADITKAGRGTLILSGTNTAGGGANKTTLNEGVLEIAGLDNIGGNTGALVFAGGTLRLGSTFNVGTDILSTRTISFLIGGGTLDTNGLNPILAGSLGSGDGGFTKTGLGNLTLNGTATYTGNSVLALGTVTVGAANALGNGGNLTLAGGTTLALGTNSLTHGLVTTSGASPAITGTGTINASTGFFLNHTGDTTIDAVLAGTGGLLKAQTNTVTLSGANTYTGTTEIQAGTLSVNSISNVGGGASALGNVANAENGIIRMGLTTAATTLTYTGSGHTSDRHIGMQGTTGGVTLNGNGTGAVGYGGARFENAGNKTLTLRGTSAPALVNTIGALQEIGGVLTLNKTDANTWQINQASSYTGITQVDNGTLRIGVTDALPTATTVRIGTGSTAGTLDLNGFNQTIGSLLVQTNNNAVTNNLIVDTGNTLTITGAVTIGVNADNSDTNFNASGGGSVLVNSGGANFQVGGATGGTNENRVDVDFTGLDTFTANLGTGTLRLGDDASGTNNMATTFKLATNNSITAANIRIGDGTGGTDVHMLTLGSGVNNLNADLINVGSAANRIRSSGAMVFDAGDTNGTVTVRASDGTGRATINMINTTGNTAGNMEATLNFTGHGADILASTMTLAARTTGTGAATATLSFDQGILDVTTLDMASRTGAGTGNATATVNLGDSAAPGVPTVNIGTLNMAVNTSSGGTVTADLNVTGGNVTIGTGSGTAINMANAGTGRTVTSNINLTGGTVTVTGDIIRTGGAGTENETLTLNGSTLNLSGNNIGTGGTDINFAAQSGTLQNLGELNGGGTLAKTTAGTLILEGTNTYSGATQIDGGTLQLGNGGTTGTMNTSAGAISVATGATFAVNRSNTVDQGTDFTGTAISGDGAFAQIGAGTTILDSANTYTGGTTVSAGTLLANNTTGSATGTGTVTVGNTATLGGVGTIAGNTTVQSGATLTGGTTTSIESLQFNNGLTMESGSIWLVNLVNQSTSSDLINVTSGTLSLAGSLNINQLSGTFAADGSTYTIAMYTGSLGGTGFSNVAFGNQLTIGGGTWLVTDTGSSITLTAVPEPGTLTLLGLGLGGLIARRIRQRMAARAAV